MTRRFPISSPQNSWFDSEQVSASDLILEQNHNNAAQTSLIGNQIGSGALPDKLIRNVLFDSFLAVGNLDGVNNIPQKQPSDLNLGNQLEISLTGSTVAGQKTIKIAIIGLDFNGNLQYDTFTFKINEKQYTKKHYANVLTILFNDFIGVAEQSFNLGGRIIISEAAPFTISRDTIMVAQDVQPNLFFRDFFVSGNGTLTSLLSSALPLYNLDNLNIQTGLKENQILSSGDVTSQIGEKFLARTNNIQKVTLLLSIQNTLFGQESNLIWAGDLIISIYALQSTVNCITDIIPNLPIEFSPFNIPLAQVSFNYNTLQARGITLDGTPQPVDFIFSNTPIANGSIVPGSFYAITLKRSGSANQCDILIAAGANQSSNSRVTTFTGNVWVDIPQDDLWYQVWTDAIQISDGQAYENGQGLVIPKVLSNQDYSLNGISFSGTSNATFSAVLSSIVQKTGIEQDQRTGNDVFSQQQYVPNVSLLNVIDLGNLEAASEPLVIGTVSDKNIKSSLFISSILAKIHAWTFVGNTISIKMIDDISDGYRYDQNVLSLVSYLTQGALINAKIIPDISTPSLFYRIADAELCTMIYGDVNGDGIIDIADVSLAEQLIGANLNSSPPLNSQITTDGYHTTVVNGYETLTNSFVNIVSGANFQIVNSLLSTVLASGSDGILVVNPNNGSLGSFDSSSVLFSNIANIAEMNLVIFGDTNQQNNGSFQILTVDPSFPHIIDVSKLLLNKEVIGQIMRADIDGNFIITANDGYLIQNFINKSPPFPATSPPSSKIGTPFSVLQITIDPFTYLDVSDTIPDRTDDFSALPAAGRAERLHTAQDIFINDGYIQNHDFFNQPISFNIFPQFTWEEYLVTVNGNARFVPTIFTSQSGLTIPSCTINGINCEVYAEPPAFDPGRVDVFVPNNIIIGHGGELLNPDGSNYKVDFEIGTIVLEVPDGFYGNETTINIFDNFIADTGLGVTRLGFPAMRFSDCSLVSTQALFNNQVSFSIAVQSFSPNTNGIDDDGYSGPIVDGRIGVAMNYATGQLTLNFTNLFQDAVLNTRNTKIQVTVFLKKGGFNNAPLFVDNVKVGNLLNLNNIFSGAGINGAPFPIQDIAGGDLSGFYPNPTVIALQNNALQSGILGSSQDGFVLTWVNADNLWEAKPAAGSGAAFAPQPTAPGQVLTSISAGPLPGSVIWDLPGGFQIVGFSKTHGSLFEVGATDVSPQFTASYNEAATSAQIIYTQQPGSPLILLSPFTTGTILHTFTSNTNGASASFQLSATNGLVTRTSTLVNTWALPFLSDITATGSVVATQGFLDTMRADQGVQLHTVRAGTYLNGLNVGAGQISSIATPTALGAPTFTDINGFVVVPTLVGTVAGYTNPFGVVISMDLYTVGGVAIGTVRWTES